MNKNALLIVITGLIIGTGFLVFGSLNNSTEKVSTQQVQNVEIIDGVQYITINAMGGYSPRISSAKAGIPTKLIVRTNGTFDCSAALSIRSIGYQKVLPQTGEEIIDLGTPQAGVPLQGTCSMGMYNFVINFN